MAAARAPAIAAARFSDRFTSDVLELLRKEASDPGFKEKGSSGFGRGNFTGSGDAAGEIPRIAASYILKKKIRKKKEEQIKEATAK